MQTNRGGAAFSQSDAPRRREAQRTRLFPRHVRVLAYGYLVSVPFEIDFVIGGRSLAFWVATALIAAVALQFPHMMVRRQISFNGKVVAPVFALGIFAWLSYYWSIDPALTARSSLVLTLSVLTWFVLAWVLADSLGEALVAFVLGTSLMAVVVLSADVNIDQRADIAANVNDVAVLIAISAGLLVARISRPNASLAARTLQTVLLTAHMAALLATGSRAGSVALIVALGVFLLSRLLRLDFGMVATAFTVAIVVVIGLLVFDFTIPERVAQIPSALESNDLSFREVIWGAALKDLPTMVGIGFGATPTYMLNALGLPAVMHSVYLGLALELGVAGSVIFAWMVTRFFIEAKKCDEWGRELLMMAAVVAVMGATLTLETRRPLWVLLALVASVSIVRPSVTDAREESS